MFSTQRKSARRLLSNRWLCAVVVLLIGWPFLAWGAAQFLIVRTETVAQADAIAVLGGSSAYVERTRRAAQLFHEGRAPKIILTNDNGRSGWSSAEQRNPFFVERAMMELERAGVPAENIERLPQPVHSTHDEAVLLREYAEANHLRSLLVVTSAYHSRRALWTLRRVFNNGDKLIALDPAATGQELEQSPSPLTWWWKSRGWRAVALEYPKLVYYWLRY